MKKVSAGFLMYRIKERNLEIFLVHHGGPYWKGKDIGAWSIPKGIIGKKESLLEGAKREFIEETGIIPRGEFASLGEVKEKSGKIIHAWAFENDWNGQFVENIISIEYPKNSGVKIKIPEIDKVSFFRLNEAKIKIDRNQKKFIKRLQKILRRQKISKTRKEMIIKLKKKLSLIKNWNVNASG